MKAAHGPHPRRDVIRARTVVESVQAAAVRALKGHGDPAVQTLAAVVVMLWERVQALEEGQVAA